MSSGYWTVDATVRNHSPNNSQYMTGGLGPSHRSCAMYAALVCPWLKYSRSKGRRGGSLRGAAALVGFRDYRVITGEPDYDPYWDAHVPTVGHVYSHLVERVPFGRSSELAPAYADSLDRDATQIDTATRWFWTDSAFDVELLSGHAARYGVWRGKGRSQRAQFVSVGDPTSKRWAGARCPFISVGNVG